MTIKNTKVTGLTPSNVQALNEARDSKAINVLELGATYAVIAGDVHQALAIVQDDMDQLRATSQEVRRTRYQSLIAVRNKLLAATLGEHKNVKVLEAPASSEADKQAGREQLGDHVAAQDAPAMTVVDTGTMFATVPVAPAKARDCIDCQGTGQRSWPQSRRLPDGTRERLAPQVTRCGACGGSGVIR